MNRLSATGFALCDEQPGCPRSRFSSSITSPRWRALPPASQAARSLMAREKQMPLSASLVFLSCSLYSTIGLKGNTVNGMTFKPIQIWYYSSFVASWEQISHLRENLLPGNYERSAERHFMSKRCCEAAENIEDALLRMKWRGELLEYYAWISRTRQYCFREKCFSTTPYTLNPNC